MISLYHCSEVRSLGLSGHGEHAMIKAHCFQNRPLLHYVTICKNDNGVKLLS